MLINRTTKLALTGTVMGLVYGNAAIAGDCSLLPDHQILTTVLNQSVAPNGGGTGPSNGGLDVPMWATMVDNRGRVCAVTFTGATNQEPWQASRAISAQKAYTAVSLSSNKTAPIWSTALLYTPTQPGQFLWGLHQSNPVNPAVVYGGDQGTWGTPDDPMVGQVPGGVNTFGGGVTLWNTEGQLIGAVGLSGDTSCADHNIALRVRNKLRGVGLGDNPAGRFADNIVYDIVDGVSASGLGHPDCPGTSDDVNEQITGIQQPQHDAWPSP